MSSRLTREPIALDELIAEVTSSARGGTCVFLGSVRADPEGGGVVAIEYSAYAEMAEAEIDRILVEARGAHPDARVTVRHRLGRVPAGTPSIAVVAAAPHREQAFAACRFVLEEAKRSLPVWKKELRADGTATWADPPGRPAAADARR